MNQSAHLLVVDDDSRIRELLRKFLVKSGFLVTSARNASKARRMLSGIEFDMIVLDVMMPFEDGVTFTRSLRDAGVFTPILLLTAKAEVLDRIGGLEAGADDYLPKPFEPQELLLRINAVLKRMAKVPVTGEHPGMLRFGKVIYDIRRGEMWRGDTLVPLTSTEAHLMRIFAKRPGEPVTRAALAGEIGQSRDAREIPVQGRAVDTRVIRLRRKIESDPGQPRYLRTVRNSGYMLAPD